MTQLLWSKFIPVEPRPVNMSFSKVITGTEHRQMLQSYLPSLLRPDNHKETRFRINLHFYINSNKHKKHPKTDLDNLIKGTLDSLTGFFWQDDSQIDEINAKVTRQAHKAGINLKVYEINQP